MCPKCAQLGLTREHSGALQTSVIDAADVPSMTLRGGAAVDGYDKPPAHDPCSMMPTWSLTPTGA